MRIAYMILCHKNPKHINLLIQALTNENCDFYLHIDKKSNIEDNINKLNNVFIIDKEKRVDIKWGQSSMINATLLLIGEIVNTGREYDYILLMSGQDFPIKSFHYINNFFKKNKGKNFIQIIDNNSKEYKRYLKRNMLYYPKWIVNNKLWIKILKKLYIVGTGGYNHTFIAKRRNTTGLKFYFGSQWWALTYDCVRYIFEYTNKNPETLRFFDNTIIPDECFFQTIFMKSPFADTQRDYLTYIDWGNNGRSPKTFAVDDYGALMDSECLFARKFDEDSELIEKIMKNVKNQVL